MNPELEPESAGRPHAEPLTADDGEVWRVQLPDGQWYVAAPGLPDHLAGKPLPPDLHDVGPETLLDFVAVLCEEAVFVAYEGALSYGDNAPAIQCASDLTRARDRFGILGHQRFWTAADLAFVTVRRYGPAEPVEPELPDGEDLLDPEQLMRMIVTVQPLNRTVRCVVAGKIPRVRLTNPHGPDGAFDLEKETEWSRRDAIERCAAPAGLC